MQKRCLICNTPLSMYNTTRICLHHHADLLTQRALDVEDSEESSEVWLLKERSTKYFRQLNECARIRNKRQLEIDIVVLRSSSVITAIDTIKKAWYNENEAMKNGKQKKRRRKKTIHILDGNRYKRVKKYY